LKGHIFISVFVIGERLQCHSVAYSNIWPRAWVKMGTTEFHGCIS